MNWMHIPSSESCYNITVSDHMKIYQFAISANSQSSLKTGVISLYNQPTSISSGMVWASCTVLHNKSINISIDYFIGRVSILYLNIVLFYDQ